MEKMQSQRFIDSAVRLIVHKIRLVKVVVDMIQLDTFQFDSLNRSTGALLQEFPCRNVCARLF